MPPESTANGLVSSLNSMAPGGAGGPGLVRVGDRGVEAGVADSSPEPRHAVGVGDRGLRRNRPP